MCYSDEAKNDTIYFGYSLIDNSVKSNERQGNHRGNEHECSHSIHNRKRREVVLLITEETSGGRVNYSAQGKGEI
jgi:hypothetical protein